MTTFSDLGLAETLLRAIEAEGYETPTPIQAAVIPHLLQGKDVLGIAQTGTGKTASFVLPILERLIAKKGRPPVKACRALILTPTRELAAQIDDEVRRYSRFARISTTVVVGGVKPGPQVRALARGVDIMVATPGRLLDHLSTGAVTLDAVTTVVLDEADQMLDLGFLPAIKRIGRLLPKSRQTVLMSATMPDEIRRLAGEFQTDPVEVAVAPVSRPIEQIAQSVIAVGRDDKRDILARILSDDAVTRAIVFTRTKHGADRVVRVLAKAGIGADAIHGNKSQGQRERALAKFRSGSVTTLIATDIAARGIDVAGITHVINYDLPEVPETYVHRIGRTARAGNTGIAISLCSPDETPLLKSIERLIKVDIASTGHRVEPRGAAPDKPKPQRASRNRNRRRGGNGGQRPQRQPHRGDDIGAVAFLRDSNRPAADPTS